MERRGGADPGRFRQVVEGRWAVADVVEEFLRYETPRSSSCACRWSRSRSGASPWAPSSGPPALSFAFGAHYCLGASLARAEAEVMLAAVVQRWPRLARRPDRPLRWHQRGPFRGLDALVVGRGATP